MDSLTPSLKRLLDSWLDEDLGRGDLSTVAIPNKIASAHWVAKQEGIFCGGYFVKHLFMRLDQSIEIKLLIEDGEKFTKSQKLLEINGPARSLLAGERTSLNLAMHLSGIATKTAELVAELRGTGIDLADTRKTTPGLRIFEKYAVKCGGGINHRLGLDDAAMLKENHLRCAKEMEKVVRKIREAAPWTTKIIIEAEDSDQAKQAVLAGADGVLLDEIAPIVLNKLVPELRELAKNRHPSKGSREITIEASGIQPTKLKTYVGSGIDLISTSASITKSSWIDFSMRFDNNL